LEVLSLGQTNAERGDRIGDHYKVEAELGHGGMARVYHVADERTGQHFALKKLLVPNAEQRSTLQTMFEREYHTLVQLAHPRIVRAFDYGVDEADPYYTMELLEGTDLRSAIRAGALSVRDVCLLLRDVGSALALIHSRRLLHRDVSPRNVWRTADGRGKLLDFGTLVAMGPQARVAGTAPFLPPEAVFVQPLDARSDLYALGALAYLSFTKRNAYPAREIGDLRQLWRRRLIRPDVINPQVPRALADLVMALLSLDARGRPASAAEVVERLTAIGDLPAEDERHLAQAFLASPTLVGRTEASAFIRKHLMRARRGHCVVASIVAPAGLGRSRMLASAVLEGKLMGAIVLSLDAGAAGNGPLALMSTLAERLVEAAPPLPPAVLETVTALGYISPALHRALGTPALPAVSEFDRMRKMSSALIGLVSTLSREHHLMIAVDDVHRADGPSMGVLARLAALPGAPRLLLLTTCDETALMQASPLLEQFAKAEDRFTLTPLAPDDTRALLGSLFGEVPGLDDAAHWLHELSRGSPQTCMQYAQYLVDHGLARYAGGQWHLRGRLRDQALPPTLGAMLEARLSTWSADACALALGLALARDDSRAVWQPDYQVLIEDFPRLLEDAHESDARATTGARTFAALDELVRAGTLTQHDQTYVLSQRAMVDALLRMTSDEQKREMHRRLALIFKRDVYRVRMSIVGHLLHAGEYVAARELLQSFTAGIGGGVIMDWGAMRVSVTAACTTAAVEHWQAHGGSPREGILLRRLLLLGSSVYDWRTANHGEAQLAQLQSDIGLGHWDATDPALPVEERVRECMKRARAIYDATPEPERGFAPEDALSELTAAVMSIYGAFVNRHEASRVRRIAAVLEPLRKLDPTTNVVADLVATGASRVTGADLGDSMLGNIQALLTANGLPEVLQQGGAGISLYAQAIEDARRGRERAQALVQLMASRVGEEMFLIVHVRWLCNAFRGQADRAAQYRKQAEVITEDDIWRRKASLFVEAELHELTGDLPSLKRTSEAIAPLAEMFPGWQPWLSWTRGVMHRLRGELDAAQAELEAALALAPAGEHRAWVRAAPAHAELLLLRGDAEGGLRESAAIIETCERLALDPMAAFAAERVRAMCASKLGDHAAARSAIERAFHLARTLECDGLPLAKLHEAHARVLLAADATTEFAEALESMHALIEHADAPALIQAYETLRAESSQLALPQLEQSIALPRPGITDSSQIWTTVSMRLNAHEQRADRARQAVSMLIEDCGARVGHLFLLDAGGLFVAASSDEAIGVRLLPVAQKHLELELSRSSSDALTVALPSFSPLTRAALSEFDAALTPVLLSNDDGTGRSVVTGVALLGFDSSNERVPRADLIEAISRALELSRDSFALPLEH
jgi:tetratricopeptide (TPR) repeat protein